MVLGMVVDSTQMGIFDSLKPKQNDERARWQAEHDAKMRAWSVRTEALFVMRQKMSDLAEERARPGSPEDLFLTLAAHSVCGGNRGEWPMDYDFVAENKREYVCYRAYQLGLENVASSGSAVTVHILLGDEVEQGISEIRGYAVDITSPDSGKLRYRLLLAKKKLILNVSDAVDKKLSGDKFGMAHIFLSECCNRIDAIELGRYHPSYKEPGQSWAPPLGGSETFLF